MRGEGGQDSARGIGARACNRGWWDGQDGMRLDVHARALGGWAAEGGLDGRGWMCEGG